MTGMILGLTALLTLTTGGPTQQPAAAQEKAAPAVRPAQAEGWTNVRLELSITDQTSAGDPVRKTVTLLLANGGDGRVRSQGMVFREATASDRRSAFEVTLNADARIIQIEGSRIRTAITVEYAPSAEGTPAQDAGREQRGSTLNQSVWVVLTSGEPTVIVESSDPLSDRKVTLAATATIVR
ncbi:MAG: hypothetical protein M3Q55_04730 [Acidobacteriota bacterium]|nr:hypothetical protein [Acidobacteriota bacterium]